MGSDTSFPEPIYLEHDLTVMVNTGNLHRNYTDISGGRNTSDLIVQRLVTSFDYTFTEASALPRKISTTKIVSNNEVVSFSIFAKNLYSPTSLGFSLVILKENEITSDGLNLQLV